MNPADPLTSTLWGTRCSLLLARGTAGRPAPDLLGGQPRAEREAVPAQVAGNPVGDLKARDARLPVQPDGRDLCHRPAQPPGLGDELDADLEAVPGVNADLVDERRRVGLERVGRVARPGVR